MAEHQKQPERLAERSVSLEGGTISRHSPTVLEPNQAADLQDLEITSLGIRTQRQGARAFGGFTEAPAGMGGYTDETFGEFLVGVWGNAVYKSVGDAQWDQVASSTSMVSTLLHQFTLGRTAGQLAIAASTCEQPTDTMVGVTGRSELLIYNIEADTATQVTLAPRTIAPFQGRLFYAVDEVLGWSEVGDFAGFSDTNQILVEPGIGGNITAILPSRDNQPRVWIMKEEAIILFQPRWGNDSGLLPDASVAATGGLLAGDELNLLTSELKTLSIDVGCVATKSARWVPDAEAADVFFLAKDGIRSLERADNDAQRGAGFPISYNIPGWIDRINFSRAHTATAAVFDNAYHVAVPMDGALNPSHVLRFDISQKAWSLINLAPKDIVNRVILEDRLYMQNSFQTLDCSVTGVPSEPLYQAYQIYRGNIDPSTSVSQPCYPPFREESRAFSFKDPLTKKQWDDFTFQVSSAETSYIAVQYRVDQGQWNTITETYIPGTADTVVLGEDALPWESQDSVKRRRTVGLSNIRPGYEMQIGLARVTGSTETGRVSIYMTKLAARALNQDAFEND